VTADTLNLGAEGRRSDRGQRSWGWNPPAAPSALCSPAGTLTARLSGGCQINAWAGRVEPCVREISELWHPDHAGRECNPTIQRTLETAGVVFREAGDMRPEGVGARLRRSNSANTRGRVTIKLILMICALALISSAAAQPSEGVHLIGTGSYSCGSWTAWRREGRAQLLEQWILGFLTGVGFARVNLDGIDPLNGVDAQAIWAWMDNYCQANPLHDVWKAGADFVTAHPR
jgi:hypothetical protein